jgi:hypothetical protein
MVKVIPCVTAASIAISVAGCNQAPSAPSDSDAAGVAVEAGPNGETLKVQPPTVLSPTNELTLDTRRPTMVINNV